MNTKNYKPMTEEQTKTLLPILMSQGQEPPYDEFKTSMLDENLDHISAIIIKRIDAFKLPHFEPSAIMMLSVLSEGNPGKSILGLIEVLEKYDKLKPEKIDASFISQHVFPWGFFNEKYGEELYDKKRNDGGKNYKYSGIFM